MANTTIKLSTLALLCGGWLLFDFVLLVVTDNKTKKMERATKFVHQVPAMLFLLAYTAFAGDAP